MARASKASASSKPDPRARIVDALMELIAERLWEDVTISDVCARADVSLADFRDAFPSKGAVLAGLSRRLDRIVLDATTNDLADEPPKERLFDVLMRRLDAMAPYKAGLESVAGWAKRDPLGALALNQMAMNSMRFMLEAAGLDAATMAALDRGAARAAATMGAPRRGSWHELTAPLRTFAENLREAGQRIRARATERLKDEEAARGR
jgi:AcrR family transcriptional regulator